MKNEKPNIPLSDITFDAEEEHAVAEVIRSGWISMGERTKSFEEEFGRLIGSPHVLAVSNCTAALHLALLSLGIGSGDEVIVPSLTFIATVNAIRYTGAKPVFADIESLDEWVISPERIEECLSPRTRAIMVVHYAGFPCAMDAIMDIARKHNLYVVEDAAHGPGSWLNNRHIGTIGHIGCFSFFANKNLTTGEGGAIATSMEDLAEKIRYLRSHGMTSLSWERHLGHAFQYDIVSLGYNYRFDDIRAAIGGIQLRKLATTIKERAERYAYYVNLLEECPELIIPFRKRKQDVSHHLFPILLNNDIDRIDLMKRLRSKGIQTSIHYPPVHLFSIYRDISSKPLNLTELVGNRELTLPLHARLDSEDIDYIVRELKACL